MVRRLSTITIGLVVALVLGVVNADVAEATATSPWVNDCFQFVSALQVGTS